MSMQHIAGIMIVYRCMLLNASMLLHDKFNPEQLWQDIHQYKVTHLSLVPIMLIKLLDQSKNKQAVDTKLPEYLKYVLVGGGKLSEDLYQRALKANWPIYISYAMTEATSTIAIGQSPDKLKILEGFNVKRGVSGELQIKSLMVCSWYDDKTKYSGNTDWLNTKDIVDLEEGYLKPIGRSDNMIISGGLNISPEYVEELILSSAYVETIISDLAITKQKHPQWGEIITVLAVGDIKKLEIWAKENIKSCYRPRVFIQVEGIPRNHLGKIKRQKLLSLI